MEWKEVRLGDVCSKIGSGATPSGGKEAYKGGDYHLIRSQNVLDFAFSKDGLASINDEQANKLKNVEIIQGDVLLNITGDSVARCCIVPSEILPARVNQHVAIIRPRKEELDNHYLLYYLQHYKRQLLQIASAGATRNAITKAMIENLILPCPKSLADQHRIASILSSLDRKIELNNKINADLEEMAQAIFKNWFVDFEPFKDGKFVDSELGKIPEGWKVGRLTDVIKLMPGGTPKTSEPLYWDNGTIPFFSPKDVNGVYCFATEKHITEAGLNKCSSNLYPKDTIFITCRGTVGKVCLVACDMAMNQSNYAIKAIDGYSQYYVFFLVKSVVERLIKKSNGAVFSAITSKDFDEEILIPSQNAVEDFTNVIDGFFRRIFTIGTENSRLSLLRDTLLPRLMSGELEVPE